MMEIEKELGVILAEVKQTECYVANLLVDQVWVDRYDGESLVLYSISPSPFLVQHSAIIYRIKQTQASMVSICHWRNLCHQLNNLHCRAILQSGSVGLCSGALRRDNSMGRRSDRNRTRRLGFHSQFSGM